LQDEDNNGTSQDGSFPNGLFSLENKVLTMKDDMEATSLLAQKLISENSKTA